MSTFKKVVVFKDTNLSNVGKMTKKGSVGVKTEAFGDKENLVEHSHTANPLMAKVPIGNGTVDEASSYNSLVKEKNKKRETGKTTVEDVAPGDDSVADDTSNNTSVKEKARKKEIFKIAAEDLTGQPSEGYWERLAEERRVALQDALNENATLVRKVELLNEKVEMLEKALSESTDVIELLNEIIAENGGFGETSDADESRKKYGSSESSEVVSYKNSVAVNSNSGKTSHVDSETAGSSESNATVIKKQDDAFGDDTYCDSDDSENE